LTPALALIDGTQCSLARFEEENGRRRAPRSEESLLCRLRQLDSLSKLNVDLNVTNIAADVATIQSDKDKIEKNKQLLKRVSDDIYINETIKVMDNMIGQAALAKAK